MSEEKKRIMFVQFTDPARLPPLHHSARIFAKEEWEVLMLGVGVGSEESFHGHENIDVKKVGYAGSGLRYKLVYLLYILRAFAECVLFRPSYIYVSNPIACPVASILKSVFSTKIIYHEHDSPKDTKDASALMRVVYWTRQEIANSAVACILPHRKRAELFTETLGVNQDKVHTVWNCPEREDVIRYSAKRNESEKRISLIYIGTIGPDRLPCSIVDALNELRRNGYEVDLNIVGFEVYGRGYMERLIEYASSYDLESKINYVGTLDRKDAIRYASRCDIGISFSTRDEDVNFRWMTTASNKTFDYMAAGLAVLVSDKPEWNRLFVEKGFGESCDHNDPKNISESISKIYNSGIESIKKKSKSKIKRDWNYENKFQKVMGVIDE